MAAYLVGVRSGDEKDRAVTGHLPGTARVHLAEKEVDQDRHGPEKGVIFPVAYGGEVPGDGWRGCAPLGGS